MAEPTNRSQDAPPAYDLLFGKLKSLKAESSNPLDFSQKLCAIGTGSIFFTITLACAATIPVISIIIGSVYINDCKIEKYIPIWLIVMGVFGCISALFSASTKTYEYVKKRSDPDYQLKKTFHIKSIVDIFIFAWFIAGSVWVYQIYTKVNYDLPTSAFYCHRTCYVYSFVILTISWSLIGLACCCCICCIPLFLVIGCCAAAGASSDEPNRT